MVERCIEYVVGGKNMNILMALSQLEVTGAEVYATTVGNELTDVVIRFATYRIR